MQSIALSVASAPADTSPAGGATSASMWPSVVAHVARQASGIHLVYGEAGVGVPFAAETLVNVALATGRPVASQEVELVNPSNWQRAVKLSRAGHVVIVRLCASTREALQAKFDSVLQATPGELEELRSLVGVVHASPSMFAPQLGDVQLREREAPSLPGAGESPQ